MLTSTLLPASADRLRPALSTIIAGIGTATPATSYTQKELLDLFSVDDRRIRSMFLNGGIERRYLTLPDRAADGTWHAESQGDLLDKHRRCAIDLGARAIRACLADIGAREDEIDYLCCVTTTGFLAPGISAY